MPLHLTSGVVELVLTCGAPYRHVEIGQVIEEFDPVVEVMYVACAHSLRRRSQLNSLRRCRSDKATVEITSPFAGKVKSLNGDAGDIVRVGKMLCEIEMEGEGEGAEVDKPVDPLPPTAPGNPTAQEPSDVKVASSASLSSSGEARRSSEVWATPATRRIARENDLDLAAVTGTGPRGRILKGDVLAHVAAGSSSTPATSARPSSAPIAATSSSPSTTIPLSPVRKAMFRAMTASLQIPHFAYSETLDVTSLERLRLSLNQHIPLRLRKTLKPAEESQIERLAAWGSTSERAVEEKRFDRMTLLPLLVKALSLAMHEHPLFACTLTPPSSTSTEHTLTRRPSHDVSIALSSPSGGLYTPLLPSVDTASAYDLASRIAHLQHISLASSPPRFTDEFKGSGTITLSNVGVVGGTSTHPIIPPTGQLAIGAMGRMRVEPRYVAVDRVRAKRVAQGVEEVGDSELSVEPRLLMVRFCGGSQRVPGLMLTFSLVLLQDVTFSADHRVVEGVELAKLVESWKRLVEEPERIVGLAR